MALSANHQDTLTVDPIAMNVVNRIASGSRVEGMLQFSGGLLVQGTAAGNIHVDGALIVWADAVVRGRLRVNGDVYVFGAVGAANGATTVLECTGTVCVASTGVCNASLLARSLRLYQGAQAHGPFKTRTGPADLPVLRDTLPETP